MKAMGRIGLVSLWEKYSGVVSSTHHQADKTAVSRSIIEQYHIRYLKSTPPSDIL